MQLLPHQSEENQNIFEYLRTYQAELEAQNEDMCRTQEALEISRLRYKEQKSARDL